jgi:hypothetical protein
MRNIKRFDIITLGSPLSHLYQHYFANYDQKTRLEALNGRLCSWTNFWRIDDPIGHRVKLVAGDFIHNEPLRKLGGHMDYWKDGRVCEAILDVVGVTAGPENISESTD